jgi:hypothetical protein
MQGGFDFKVAITPPCCGQLITKRHLSSFFIAVAPTFGRAGHLLRHTSEGQTTVPEGSAKMGGFPRSGE